MRTVEILQIAAALVGAATSASGALERRLVKRLTSQGATHPEAAVELPPLRALSRWRLARLESSGAVRALPAGTYYLDEESFRALRQRRVRRAVFAGVIAVLVVVAIYAFI